MGGFVDRHVLDCCTSAVNCRATNGAHLYGDAKCQIGDRDAEAPQPTSPLSALLGPHPQPESAPSEAGAGSLAPMKPAPGTFVVLDPEYHRRQAVMLHRLARTTRDPQTSAALKQLAAEHAAKAEEQEDERAARAYRKPARE
jgi:hypothetical protein